MKQCGRQSKTFERSVSSAPNIRPWSTLLRQFSGSHIKACCALCMYMSFLKTALALRYYSVKILSHLLVNKSFKDFWYVWWYADKSIITLLWSIANFCKQVCIKSLHRFNKTLLTSLTFLLHLSFRWAILKTVTWWLSFVTLFAKSAIDCTVTCGVFSDETSFLPTWNIIWSAVVFANCWLHIILHGTNFWARKLSHVSPLCCQVFLLFPTLNVFCNIVSQNKNFCLLLIKH